MRDLLIPSNAPFWQVVLVYILFFGALAYLGVEMWRSRGKPWALGLRVEFNSFIVPPSEEAASGVTGQFDNPIGRITEIHGDWHVVVLEEPWPMWRGTLSTVRISSLSRRGTLDHLAGEGDAVLLEAGDGPPFRCHASIRYLP